MLKITVYYPEDMFDTLTWHDGSPLSVGDFVMWMIMNFDPGTEGSAIYDEGQAPTVESLLSHFKGVRIISTDPLIIETYEDQYFTDAELNFRLNTWYPSYTYGPGAWHNVGLGVLADAAGQLAFSTDKATANEVDWMSFIAGPSLDILKTHLDQAQADTYIPYAPTMSQYVDEDEARQRYENLQTWYTAHGHFWLGTGPYYLDRVYPVEQTMTLTRYAAYPDPADRWSGFGTPMIAEVTVTGPNQVTIGQEATFDVAVTFAGAPYPQADIASVKYLVFDAQGTLIASADATFVSDGQYQVVLSADVTDQLTAGGGKIEAIISSNAVGLPTFASFEFIATAP